MGNFKMKVFLWNITPPLDEQHCINKTRKESITSWKDSYFETIFDNILRDCNQDVVNSGNKRRIKFSLIALGSDNKKSTNTDNDIECNDPAHTARLT